MTQDCRAVPVQRWHAIVLGVTLALCLLVLSILD
jgi:hypothetical protein